MKPLALLPLALISASCFYPPPYPPERPRYRDGAPYQQYGGQPPGTETGTFEPLPDGNRPPPAYGEPGPQPQPEPKPRPTYPVARATANPGRVISPYAPYNVIDVEGFESGALAKDPSNGKIFRVP